MSAGDWKEMFSAAVSGDLSLLKYHLRNGVDPNYQHPEILSTPLVAAILAGQTEAALILLEGGADPNLVSEFDGVNPRKAAKQMGNLKIQEALQGRSDKN